jgi:hypothetical protein
MLVFQITQFIAVVGLAYLIYGNIDKITSMAESIKSKFIEDISSITSAAVNAKDSFINDGTSIVKDINEISKMRMGLGDCIKKMCDSK